MFKEGPFANVIERAQHQVFFKKDFKIASIDPRFENLNQEQKLMLIDRVIDRFMEVDLDKQKQIISPTLKS